MKDEHLRASLRSLPTAKAGDGFTEAVLARVDERARRPATILTPLRLTAAAATIAVAVAVALWAPVAFGPAPDETPRIADTQAAPASPVGEDAAPPTAPSAPEPPARTARAESPAPGAAPGTPPREASNRREPGETRPPGPTTVLAAAERGDTATTAHPGDGHRVDRSEARRRLAELRRERQRLEARWAALGEAEEPPALLLAADESVELVLDLGRRPAGGGLHGDIRPASQPPRHRF